MSGTTVRRCADEFEYAFDTTPTHATFLTLLHVLPRGHELQFFDRYFPSASDPGAFVSIQRKADRFMYCVGNHGWSTGWHAQSAELLAAWMELNAAEGTGGEALTAVRIAKASPSPLYPGVDPQGSATSAHQA